LHGGSCCSAFRLRTWDIRKVRHLTNRSLRSAAHIAVAVVLLVLSVFILTLRLLFSIHNHQLLTELSVFHAELLSDLDETSEAVDVVLVVLVDVFVHLEGFVKQVHPSVTAGNHESPLNLLGLHLAGTLEEQDGFFKLILLSMMHAEA
jgi:hypothetical protein